jgi:hypothetical protein
VETVTQSMICFDFFDIHTFCIFSLNFSQPPAITSRFGLIYRHFPPAVRQPVALRVGGSKSTQGAKRNKQRRKARSLAHERTRIYIFKKNKGGSCFDSLVIRVVEQRMRHLFPGKINATNGKEDGIYRIER